MKLKSHTQLEHTLASWGVRYDDVAEIGMALGIGMLVGFSAKTFGRLIFLGMCAVVIAGVVLHNVGFVTIHTDAFFTSLGIDKAAATNPEAYVGVVLDYIRANVPVTVAGVLGCIIGWRIG